jgi:hypothetical protein
LCRDALLARAASDPTNRQRRYRHDVQGRLTRGMEGAMVERLADAVGIGGGAFVARLKAAARGGTRETSDRRAWRRQVGMPEVVEAVGRVRGEAWNPGIVRRGDGARALAMWAARRYAGMTLREIGKALGGMDYAAVGMAIRRFERQAAATPRLARQCEQVSAMLHVKT